MKISCTRENLSKAISLVGGIAGKSVNLPILGNILIKADEQKVELITTNLELAIIAHVRAKVEEKGEFTVPARTLSEFINLLSDDKIEIELKENELSITCGRSNTKIKGVPADEYPIIPAASDGNGYVLPAADLKYGLTQVLPALAKNDIRPELSGMYFGFFIDGSNNLTLAGTDSYRLAEKKITITQGQGEFKAIIPNRTAVEMNHVLSATEENEPTVRLLINNNQIVMNYNSVQLISRLVEGQYPDYGQIIPKDFKTSALFTTSQLVKEMKTASLFTTTGVNAVACGLDYKNAAIKISSVSTQTGEYASEVPAEISGDDNNILLNHRYVLDGLNHINTEQAYFNMINADSPCVFKPKDDPTFLYIVMPIRQ